MVSNASKPVLQWISISVIGSLIYSVVTFSFFITPGFSFSFFDKLLITLLCFLLSLILSSPLLILFKIFSKKEWFSGLIKNALFILLFVFALTVCWFMGLNGYEDYLLIIISYYIPGLLIINFC